MRLRLRAPQGASTLTLAEDATVADLLAMVREKTSLTNFDLKYSYPPKPLVLDDPEAPLSSLGINLNGEQLIVSARDTGPTVPATASTGHESSTPAGTSEAVSRAPIALQKKPMAKDVPEVPLPELGATLVMRVMPDDNSCLFRAFGTACLPTEDDMNMHELRSLVATTIQSQPDKYTKVVLEKEPDDYCRWMMTDAAWGGYIELDILSKHFSVEICCIDVQSLNVVKYNEGAPTRCILVYSGIHYDTIVQSPSEPPHTQSDSPPDFDRRLWDSDDDYILQKSLILCKGLQEKKYFTDTGGMAIKCHENVGGGRECGWIGYGERAAALHAAETNHLNMAEIVA